MNRSALYSSCPDSVRLVEVGPRDGLQNEGLQVPTANKVRFVEALADAGLRHIEVSSFVRPDRVEQLADAEEVFRSIHRRPGVTYTALVPNLRGWERALATGVDSISLLTAASEAFNHKNIGCSIAESLRRIREVVEKARGSGVRIRAYVSTAFVCPYEGEVAPVKVVEIVKDLGDLGIDNISLGDTVGAAYPDAVSRLLEEVAGARGLRGIALHLHDTYDRALANSLAGLLHGVEEFDCSAGGLGGCPFAPGARGNVATEKLIDFFRGQGVAVEGDRERVRRALSELPRELRKA